MLVSRILVKQKYEIQDMALWLATISLEHTIQLDRIIQT